MTHKHQDLLQEDGKLYKVIYETKEIEREEVSDLMVFLERGLKTLLAAPDFTRASSKDKVAEFLARELSYGLIRNNYPSYVEKRSTLNE